MFNNGNIKSSDNQAPSTLMWLIIVSALFLFWTSWFPGHFLFNKFMNYDIIRTMLKKLVMSLRSVEASANEYCYNIRWFWYAFWNNMEWKIAWSMQFSYPTTVFILHLWLFIQHHFIHLFNLFFVCSSLSLISKLGPFPSLKYMLSSRGFSHYWILY